MLHRGWLQFAWQRFLGILCMYTAQPISRDDTQPTGAVVKRFSACGMLDVRNAHNSQIRLPVVEPCLAGQANAVKL